MHKVLLVFLISILSVLGITTVGFCESKEQSEFIITAEFVQVDRNQPDYSKPLFKTKIAASDGQWSSFSRQHENQVDYYFAVLPSSLDKDTVSLKFTSSVNLPDIKMEAVTIERSCKLGESLIISNPIKNTETNLLIQITPILQ